MRSTFQTVSRRLILGNPNPGVGGSQELRAKVKVRGRDVLRVTGTSILIEIAYVRPVLTNLPLLGAEENSVATKRIFLLIAHNAFRDAIALVLEKEFDLEVVWQASSLAEAVNLDHNIDIALVDPSLSDGDGLAVVRQVSSRRNAANTAPIALVLTSSGSDSAIFKRALEAGAVGVFSTACSLKALVDALRSRPLV